MNTRKLSREETLKYDKLWQMAVCMKAMNLCEKCGEPAYNGAHHVVGRSRMSTRYLVENGVALCPNCHNHAHWKPIEFSNWFGDKFPERLQIIGREMRKRADIDASIELLEKEAKEAGCPMS